MTADAMLRFLCDAGLQASRMCVRAIHDEAKTVEAVLAGFAAVFHHEPAVEEVDPRRDRPDVYLLISSQAYQSGSVLPSAAGCMHGLHGLFVALHVRMAMLGSPLKS
jgi:hypothetical protein